MWTALSIGNTISSFSLCHDKKIMGTPFKRYYYLVGKIFSDSWLIKHRSVLWLFSRSLHWVKFISQVKKPREWEIDAPHGLIVPSWPFYPDFPLVVINFHDQTVIELVGLVHLNFPQHQVWETRAHVYYLILRQRRTGLDLRFFELNPTMFRYWTTKVHIFQFKLSKTNKPTCVSSTPLTSSGDSATILCPRVDTLSCKLTMINLTKKTSMYVKIIEIQNSSNKVWILLMFFVLIKNEFPFRFWVLTTKFSSDILNFVWRNEQALFRLYCAHALVNQENCHEKWLMWFCKEEISIFCFFITAVFIYWVNVHEQRPGVSSLGWLLVLGFEPDTAA